MNSGNKGFLIVLLGCLAILASCASGPGSWPSDLAPVPAAEDRYQVPPPSRVRDLIVTGGLSLVGQDKLVVDGVTYPADCTGVVRAAYAFANLDLSYRFARYEGNGVRRVYLTLRDQGLLYAGSYPTPGDIIFWDNTWDANANKLADDELTHLGLVVASQSDRSISYLHYHYRLGPTVETMNLLRPELDVDKDGNPVNAVLRMRGSPPGPGSNAAQLFRAFGKGYELSP